jgi:hypothetical protein
MFLLSTLAKTKAAAEKDPFSPTFNITQMTSHEGYLFQKSSGAFGTLKKKFNFYLLTLSRYYVLKQTKIVVYSNNTREKELESISLENHRLEIISDKKKKGFFLITEDGKKHTLYAETDQESEDWISKISEVSIRERTRSEPNIKVNKESSPKEIVSNEIKTEDTLSPSPSKKESRKSMHKFITPLAKSFSERISESKKKDDSPSPISARKTSTTAHFLTEKKKEKVTKLITMEQEFDIFLNAMHIFMKKEEERTTEELAYVLNLKLYYHQLIQHMSKTKAKPQFSLSTGTYILVKEEEFRTTEENEFMDEMKNQYALWLENKEEALKLNVVSCSQTLLQKKKSEMKKEEKEYKKLLESVRKQISIIEKKNGLKAQHGFISGTVNYLKYSDELDEQDNLYISSINKILF